MRRRTASLALGAAVTVVAASWTIPAPPAEGPRYLHAKFPLPVGILCQPQYFGMGTASEVPGDALTDQQLDACTGNRILRALRPGETLTWGHLETNNLAEHVPKGSRAYPVHSPNLRFLPGDRVDVFLRPESPAETPRLLLEGVAVLQGTTRPGKTLIAVKPDEVALLENAGRRGTLTLVLRNPKERPERRVHRRRKKRDRIPVWTEES